MLNKMNFLITNDPKNKENLLSYSPNITQKENNNLYSFIENADMIHEDEDFLGFVSGYINDLSIDKNNKKAQYTSAFKTINNTWPLPENITGSFSTVIIDKNKSSLVFCNDLIGVFPLYYYKDGTSFYIASSLIMIGVLADADFDEVGVTQATYGSEFVNVGSRTILKDVKRLLPGEQIKLNTSDLSMSKTFDNTLFNSSAEKGKVNNKDYHDYWSYFKNEIDYAITQYDKTYLALSGGMDSRLLLGSLPEDREVECLTYGDESNYEVKLAAKLALMQGHEFKSFSDLELYFPQKDTLKDYVLNTESLNVAGWLEILENIEAQKKSTILMGDMCEALPARNIKTYSSRKSRIANFFKTIVLNYNYNFTKATPENFEAWKQKTVNNELRRFSKSRIEELNLSISYEYLKAEIIKDFEELFSRIESHKLPYLELYDELFNWYTHCRVSMGKQILVCNSKFNAICPPMSIGILRKSSNIHPNNRLNYRFMNKLFKKVDDLKKINSIPTNQSPLVPHSFPSWLIFVVWGLRSRIDQFLIRKLLKNKNPKMRYRLFKSVNWVEVYQNNSLEDRLKSYFSPNHLGSEVVNSIKSEVIGRKKLENWPFTNFDIMSLSALNMKIDLIKNYQNK